MNVDGTMTVGDLRKALEGVPDDQDVTVICPDEEWGTTHLRPLSADVRPRLGSDTEGFHLLCLYRSLSFVHGRRETLGLEPETASLR